MPNRWLTAVPVYNEAKYVRSALAPIRRYSPDILVVNDGSTDGTAEPGSTPSPASAPHRSHRNRGYGAALISAFDFALQHDFDVLVTMDCDGQHEPARIPVLLEALHDCRHRFRQPLSARLPAGHAGPERSPLHQRRDHPRNQRTLRPDLTDAFCGFKAYRREALEKLRITERAGECRCNCGCRRPGSGLRIKEIGVPRLYLDPKRAFGGVMNDPDERLAYYRAVLAAAEADQLPAPGCGHLQTACPELCSCPDGFTRRRPTAASSRSPASTPCHR